MAETDEAAALKTHPAQSSRDGTVEAPTRARLAVLWAATMTALTAHNLEEWLLDMPGWAAGRPWLSEIPLHGERTRFGIALVIVTAALALLGLIAVVSQAAWSAEALSCLSHVLLVNAGSHLMMSLASWSLMPGAITGTLLFLPLGLWTIRSLPPVRWTASAVVVTAAAALAMLGGSFALAALLAP